MLPVVDCTFSIPSLVDGLELDGRLYFPKPTANKGQPLVKAFAIIAHPYAPLGGCMDDPVVQAVVASLLKSGYIVNTFNFRGANGSAGRTSWTGSAELADYVSFVVHMLHFINAPEILNHIQSHSLILGGYSYGSMIASYLPNLDSLRTYISQHRASNSIKEIASRAIRLSQVFLGFVETHGGHSRVAVPAETPPGSPRSVKLGGHDSETTSQRVRRDSLRRSLETGAIRRSMEKVRQRLSVGSNSNPRESQLHTELEVPLVVMPKGAILLISPILPPIAAFITMFSKPSFDVGDKGHPTNTQQKNLSQNQSFVIFGSKDMFTSAHKLKKWAEEICSLPQSKLSYKEINEAGHFWREPGTEELLHNEISMWCSMITMA